MFPASGMSNGASISPGVLTCAARTHSTPSINRHDEFEYQSVAQDLGLQQVQLDERPSVSEVTSNDSAKSKPQLLPPAKVSTHGYWDGHMDPPRLQAKHPKSVIASSGASSRSTSFFTSSVISNKSSIEHQRALFESRFAAFDSSTTFSTAPGTSSQCALASSRTSVESADRVVKRSSIRLVAPERESVVTASTSHFSWNPKGANTSRPPLPVQKSSVRTPLSSLTPRALDNRPGEAFRRLPKEVLDHILNSLRDTHCVDVAGFIAICPTCHYRDLCSVAAVNRQCFRSAQWKLYEVIWLVGADSTAYAKRYKSKAGPRLKLLRRTLRENVYLGSHVKELKLPDLSISQDSQENKAYSDLIATVIMACPNLERILGLDLKYAHQYSKLSHAISSRTMLTEHVWHVIGGVLANPLHRRQNSITEDLYNRQYGVVTPTLSNQESDAFAALNDNWPRLSSLVVHCAPDGIMDSSTLSRSITQLPALTKLCLSSISRLPDFFLTELPMLTSLHLSNLSGLTSQAISNYASTPQARKLTSLAMIDIPLTSLPVLARLLANMTSLKNLTFIQESSPTLPIDTSIYTHPYLSSTSLRRLTWDIQFPTADTSSDATYILSRALEANGFPNLHKLKAPCDYDGALQAHCKATANLALARDKALINISSSTRGAHRKDSGISGIYPSSTFQEYELSSSLRLARLAAQKRLEKAKTKASFRIIIEDFTSTSKPIHVASFDVGGFMGQMRTDCCIEYDLSEDMAGSDRVGLRIEDFLAYKEGDVCAEGRVCDGDWNARKRGGRRDKKRGWEHVERPYWGPLEMDRLF